MRDRWREMVATVLRTNLWKNDSMVLFADRRPKSDRTGLRLSSARRIGSMSDACPFDGSEVMAGEEKIFGNLEPLYLHHRKHRVG